MSTDTTSERGPEEIQDLARAHARKALRAMRGTGRVLNLVSHGCSMEPVISTGSRLEIELVSPDAIAPGDIVLFERAGHLVLHRVIHIHHRDGGRVLVEKGDHQLSFGLVTPEMFLGRLRGADTPDGRFDPSSPAGKRLTKTFLRWSRWEWRAFRLKQTLFGSRPSRWARPVIRAGTILRQCILHRTRRTPPSPRS